ncbi:MAG: transposase [Deltaproteobacteria bacterium]|nr:transposase [Deltaproteobacteria bacterium]
MSRQARLDAPGALHHIMVRGINKANIFDDNQDKERFLERLGQNVKDGDCSVFAWVLMDNHVHILFKSGNHGISAVMRKLLTWYAQYYNRRHKRSGHLFENRYKSILCDEDSYLIALVRYIHLNPIRANTIKTIEELDNYIFCGHRAIIGKAKHSWMNPDYVLLQFGSTRRKSLSEYRKFMLEGIGLGRQSELTGGGLLRSLGGWSQVIARRRIGMNDEGDERILGSSDFVHAVLKETEERELRQLKLKRSGMTLRKIIDQECDKTGISPMEVMNGVRRRVVSRLRAVIASRGRAELGLSSAEMARHLGVASASISRLFGNKDVKAI